MPRHNLKEKIEKSIDKNNKLESKRKPSSKKVKEEVPNISIEIEPDTDQPTSEIKNETTISELITEVSSTKTPEIVPQSKKRGRKPKGGKLILKSSENELQIAQIPNVILHLKCSLSELTDYNNIINKMVTNELTYNPEIPPEIQTYNSDKIIDNFSTYETNSQSLIDNEKSKHNYAYSDQNSLKMPKMPGKIVRQTNELCSRCNVEMSDENVLEETSDEGNIDTQDNEEVSMKDINYKLKHLKINLYKNTLQDKKSACFWCTYDYDNQPCYIPKYEMDDKIHGYGSFCRPECAVAYLMRENLDDSTKFERYHLLNHIYSKVYKYKKNIKPAPNPYYILDRFYGNLSIQEYRKLLKTEHLLTVIEKPMSRILPELYEDNDNFLLGIYGNVSKTVQTNNNNNTNGNANSNVYKVKRQSEQTTTTKKSTIMKEKFNLQ
jgi:hypothetical protein